PRSTGRAWRRSGLNVDGAHPCGVVALASRRGNHLGDPLHLRRAQLDVGCGEVLLQVGDALGAGDRDDVLPAVQHPREGELPRGDALLLGQLTDAFGQQAVVLEVLAGEARAVAAEVALVELLWRGEAPGEEAASEGRVGDEGD